MRDSPTIAILAKLFKDRSDEYMAAFYRRLIAEEQSPASKEVARKFCNAVQAARTRSHAPYP
jgi:hypothetical protein